MKLPRMGELVKGFVGIWLFMIISASLLPAIVAPEPEPAPYIGIFSLLPLLVVIAVVLLLVGWALGVWKTPTAEDERG